MERVPSAVLNKEIFGRLDVEALCSLACVNRALRLSVESQADLCVSSLNLCTIALDGQTLVHILRRCRGLHSVTLNCLRLQDHSLRAFLSPRIHELNLWCCSSLSCQILVYIGRDCPNLRVLTLELTDKDPPDVFRDNLAMMLNGCLQLESLSLRIRGIEVDASAFWSIVHFLPRTIKTLKLQPVRECDAILLVKRVSRNLLETQQPDIPTSSFCSSYNLRSLSLVLDVITDDLLVTITTSLPLLVELDLEDRPDKEHPLPYRDLTNRGLQSLSACHHLTGLSLIRNGFGHQVPFRRVNDMGMFLLSEGCRGLESVRLCGFSKVSDAGFAAILHSCQSLKRFEVRSALLLSDLAFHDLTRIPCALVEVRLLSCRLITSEAVKKLASSRRLEVLDLGGCKSIADTCLRAISRLRKLTALNLTGSDITDSGLSILAQGSLPITNLSLRGCKRVTDKGVTHLLCGGGSISQSLTSLDLGYMAGISDVGILTIASAGIGIIDLCIRSCFYVTDASIEALARMQPCEDKSKKLRRLDLSYCTGLSCDSLRWLERPLFRGLHWLGIGKTRLASNGDATTKIHSERKWLTLCLDGCEMGCHDGWQFHE